MQVDSDAKPLYELNPWADDPAGMLGTCVCYPYTLTSKPRNKGPRVDSIRIEVIHVLCDQHLVDLVCCIPQTTLTM